MDFSSICRTCIKTFSNIGLNPIFLSEDTHERFSSAFYSCTGVQVKFNDGLPQNMCTACMNQYNSTLKFRKQCKQAEKQLLKFKTEIDCKNYQNEQCFTENTEKHNLDINDTEIKSEFKIKKELDINVIEDENKPLKYFINNKESNSLLKINKDSSSLLKINKDSNALLKINKNDGNNTPNISDSECFTDNITFIKNSFKTDNTDTKTKTKLKLNIPETNDAIDIPYVIMENVKKKTMRVVCKLCQKELSIRSIDSHMMRSHPGADPRKVKCELCDKYVMKEKLNRHRVMMHGSVGVRCGYCKSEFNSKEALVSHVATCSDKKKRRKGNESGRAIAECDICHMTMQKASLNKHKAVKHAGLRPVCEHCGKSFGNKFRLNEHYRAKHGYEKFKCSYCDFRSAGIMAMRNHERRHRGEKPYICETCGAKFHAAYLLMQHKHSHNTEKLVKCDLCPASFKANNNLHMHKLTCHSKSYYSCTLCSRTYKCRYYGIKHVRLAHHVTDASEVIKVILARQ